MRRRDDRPRPAGAGTPRNKSRHDTQSAGVVNPALAQPIANPGPALSETPVPTGRDPPPQPADPLLGPRVAPWRTRVAAGPRFDVMVTDLPEREAHSALPNYL